MNGFSQDSTKTKLKDLFWVSGGYGIPYTSELSGNYLYKKNLFTARYSDYYFLSTGYAYDEYSFLYGRTFVDNNHIFVSTSMGFGLMNITSKCACSVDQIVENNSANLSMEIQIILPFFKFMGIGLKAFTNIGEQLDWDYINQQYKNKNITGGAIITLQFGKFR